MPVAHGPVVALQHQRVRNLHVRQMLWHREGKLRKSGAASGTVQVGLRKWDCTSGRFARDIKCASGVVLTPVLGALTVCACTCMRASMGALVVVEKCVQEGGRGGGEGGEWRGTCSNSISTPTSTARS